MAFSFGNQEQDPPQFGFSFAARQHEQPAPAAGLFSAPAAARPAFFSPSDADDEERNAQIGRDVLAFFNNHPTDVTFVVQNEDIPAHKMLVAARSEYFCSMLFGEIQESASDRIPIENGISAALFRKLLQYLYSGTPGVMSPQEYMDLLPYADMYQLVELKFICETGIKTNMTCGDVLQVLRMSRMTNADRLKSFAMEFILKNCHSTVLWECVNTFPIENDDDAKMIKEVLVESLKKLSSVGFGGSKPASPFGTGTNMANPFGSDRH